jgi:hypothetical protein
MNCQVLSSGYLQAQDIGPRLSAAGSIKGDPMTRRRKRPNKPHEEHTHVGIRIERYEARVGASVNSYAYAPQYAWDLDEDDPLYEFTNQVTITGISTYPSDRMGDAYELIIYGTDSRSHRLNAKLKDVHARDTNGSLRYREYRGKQIPIYVPPHGLGHVDKVRGERRWTAWLFVPPRFVNDVLVLLSHQRNLFLGLHERKIDRSRWVQGIAVQTNDPAEE